ncbi:autotransporter outer membrane beta-barrel domain-containing protein [Pseudomonas sp. O64]|uniref:autotransporter outer membrane beta-barrel domain-containing protein n=1 Tax=unclassified Pseudomonas TaxID=196821 RepID=UPI00387B4CC2
MVLVKKAMAVAISSALSVMTLSVPAARADDYEKIDISSEHRESRTIDNAHVVMTGSGAAVHVSGAQNQLQGDGYDVHATAASKKDAVIGLHVEAGGSAVLSNVNIATAGSDRADAVVVTGANSRISLNNLQIVTEGATSRGVVATKGGQAILSGGSISTSGYAAEALSASGAGSRIDASNMTLTNSSTSNGTVVRAADGASIALDKVAVNAQGNMEAIAVEGSGSSLTAKGVNLTAAGGVGVRVSSAAFTFSDGSITAEGDGVLLSRVSKDPGGMAKISNSDILSKDGYGVNVNADAATASLDTVRITTLGNYGSGIWLPGKGSQAHLKNTQIETFGSQATGIDNRAGQATINGGSTITHGSSSHALYASADTSGSPGAAFDVKGAQVETFGRSAMGAVARLSGAEITIRDSQVVTHGASSTGLFASGRGASVTFIDSDLLTEGESAHGLAVSNNGTGQLQGANVKTLGDNAHGVNSYATSADVVNNIEVNSSQIETQNGVGILVSGGGLNTRLTDSHLLARTAGEPGIALRVTDNENGVLAQNVQVDSVRSQIAGDVVVDAGTLHLNLNDHSALEGAIKDNAQSAQLAIDKTSAWTLTADSTVSHLANAGVVEFADPGLAGAFKQLSVAGDLTGNGRYIMNTNLGLQAGDRLLVGGQIMGQNQILVRNSGGEPDAAGRSLRLVESAGGPGSFSLANTGAVVDAGTFRYALQAGVKPGSWDLVNVGQTPGPGPGPGPGPVPGPENLSTGANAAINSSAIATLRGTWDAERATLVQRVGELREGSGGEGVWVRGFGQQQSLDNGVGRDFSQQVQGTQVGIDMRISKGEGVLVVGGLAGYSQTNRNFKGEGNGTLDSYHVGAYATYLDDTGWYVDNVLTLNRWDTRLDVIGTDGIKVSGHSRSQGAGGSVELGKQIRLQEGWFVEPQVQVSLLYVAADSYRLDNGLKVDAGDGVSTQMRAGARTGRKLVLDNGMHLQPYLKAGWVEDFSAQNTIKTNGISSHPDGSGGGWYAGAGLTGELDRRQQVFADVETSQGSSIDRPWAVNVGYRFSW